LIGEEISWDMVLATTLKIELSFTSKVTRKKLMKSSMAVLEIVQT